jgi:hypothetical protein
MKYIVVGGSYFGSASYTALSVLMKSDSLEEVQSKLVELSDQCGGLIIVIDCTTGEVV